MTEHDLIERKLDSKLIFDGRILHVCDDAVMLPNGHTASRELIRHVGAVCVIPILDDGRVIVERQFRYPVGKVLTEIPAGKLDSKDEDPELAARRELREETGAVEFEMHPICVYSVTGKTRAVDSGEETFGMLYHAQIHSFEEALHNEIAQIELFEVLPDNWTYPQIQPLLLREYERRKV